MVCITRKNLFNLCLEESSAPTFLISGFSMSQSRTVEDIK